MNGVEDDMNIVFIFLMSSPSFCWARVSSIEIIIDLHLHHFVVIVVAVNSESP